MNHSSQQEEKPWVIEAPKPRTIIFGLLAFFVFSSLLFLKTKPPIFMDEAIYAETVTRFNQGLGLSNTLFRDYITLVEQHAYWYPPVYFLLLSPLFWLFGPSLVVGRLLSFVLGLLSLGLIYKAAKIFLVFPYLIVFVLALLITDPYFQDATIVLRMEIMSVFWGLAALLIHLNWLKTNSKIQAFLTGLFSVLSLLTHPTGVIFVAPVGLSLLLFPKLKFKQRLLTLVCFGAPIIIGLFLWFLSFRPNLDIFIVQNQLQLHRKEYGIYFVLETFRYKPLHRLILMIYSLSNLWFLAKGIIKKEYWQPKTLLFMFLAFTSLVLTVLLKEMWYVVYLPVVGSLLLLKNLEWYWQRKIYWPMVIAALVLFMNILIYLEAVDQATNYKQSYEDFSQKISEYLPQKSKVLLSSMPDPYFYFQAHRPDLILRETPNSQNQEPIDVAVYNQVLADVDYVVFSFVTNNYLGQYWQKNLDSVLYQGKIENGDYGVMVIKLKSAQERLPLEVEPHLQWQYPQLGSFK